MNSQRIRPMKPGILPLLLALAAAPLHAQQGGAANFLPDKPGAESRTVLIKYALLKPEDKTSEVVKPSERNPFGKSEEELRTVNGKGTNEENLIREHLQQLRVVGVSPGAKGLRVMLGDMILEPGQEVPPVLPDQTLALRVGNITPQMIELVWVEKKGSSLPPRMLTIPVDLRPSVRYVLHGQKQEPTAQEKSTAKAIGPRAVGTQFLQAAARPAPTPTPATPKPDAAANAASAAKPSAAPTPPAPQRAVGVIPPRTPAPGPAPVVPLPETGKPAAPTGPDPAATASAPTPATPPLKAPAVWNEAMVFLNNLVKLEGANKE